MVRATDTGGEFVEAGFSVTVLPVNDAPVATDDGLAADEDNSLEFNALTLLANDSDVDGDTLSIVDVSQPANGQLIDHGDGSYSYVPDEHFNGVDSLSTRLTTVPEVWQRAP